MTSDEALTLLARKGGVHDAFTDMNAKVRQIGPETQRALLAANGIASENDKAVRDSLAFLEAEASDRVFPQDLIVTSGKSTDLQVSTTTVWSLLGEDEQDLIADGRSEGTIQLPALKSVFMYFAQKRKTCRKKSLFW